jgi:hypothetical protein
MNQNNNKTGFKEKAVKTALYGVFSLFTLFPHYSLCAAEHSSNKEAVLPYFQKLHEKLKRTGAKELTGDLAHYNSSLIADCSLGFPVSTFEVSSLPNGSTARCDSIASGNYSPPLMQGAIVRVLGKNTPDETKYFLAHEYGHLRYYKENPTMIKHPNPPNPFIPSTLGACAGVLAGITKTFCMGGDQPIRDITLFGCLGYIAGSLIYLKEMATYSKRSIKEEKAADAYANEYVCKNGHINPALAGMHFFLKEEDDYTKLNLLSRTNCTVNSFLDPKARFALYPRSIDRAAAIAEAMDKHGIGLKDTLNNLPENLDANVQKKLPKLTKKYLAHFLDKKRN